MFCQNGGHSAIIKLLQDMDNSFINFLYCKSNNISITNPNIKYNKLA